MAERDFINPEEEPSYGHILKDISENTRRLVRSEVALMRAELKTTLPRVAKHSRQLLIFGAVCALSVFPFLAFLVIGLGKLLNENYMLSSLLVAVIFAAVGAPIALSSFKKIKAEDINLSGTKMGATQSVQALQEKIREVAAAVKGESQSGYHH